MQTGGRTQRARVPTAEPKTFTVSGGFLQVVDSISRGQRQMLNRLKRC
jgi:hypothetical protein